MPIKRKNIRIPPDILAADHKRIMAMRVLTQLLFNQKPATSEDIATIDTALAVMHEKLMDLAKLRANSVTNRSKLARPRTASAM